MMDLLARLSFAGRTRRETMKAALTEAQARVGGEGQGIAWSAGLLFGAFVLLALAAPIGVQLPGMLGTAVTGLPLLVMLAGLVIGLRSLLRVIKADQAAALDSPVAAGSRPTVPEAAVNVALADAERAGLLKPGTVAYDDVLSGVISDWPMISVRSDKAVIAVMRIPASEAGNHYSPIIVTPAGKPWPFAMPDQAPLTPLTPPDGLGLQAWGPETERDGAQQLLQRLAPAFSLAENAGALPRLSLLGRSLVLRWEAGDVAGAAVIMHAARQALSSKSA